jgi:hypothetical protein
MRLTEKIQQGPDPAKPPIGSKNLNEVEKCIVAHWYRMIEKGILEPHSVLDVYALQKKIDGMVSYR